MKRSLLSQMWNNRRDNVWLMLGLTLVSLTIWFFSSSLYTTLKYYFVPLGFDETDVMVFNISQLRPDSPEYVECEEGAEEGFSNDLKALMRRIRESPHVEAAGFSIMALPYTGSYSGGQMRVIRGNDTVTYETGFRRMSPDLIYVLRPHSRTGKDLDWLKQRLEAGEVLVSNTFGELQPGFVSGEDIIGASALMFDYMDEDRNPVFKKLRIADAVDYIRRNKYERPFNGTFIDAIDESKRLEWVNNIVVRVKPGHADRFREEFDSSPDMIQHRNASLYDLTMFSDWGRDVERNKVLNVRLYCIIIGFMLLIIFLGLLGTFWFRIQQRVGEIAIRRVCGATRFEVFRRVIGEGMLLLIGASVLAAIIGWGAILYLNYDQQFTKMELFYLELATIALMAFGIILSVSWPAILAMRINPAEAVKDE